RPRRRPGAGGGGDGGCGRLRGGPAGERIGEGPGGRVPVLGPPRHRLENDPIELGGNVGVAGRRRARILVHDLVQDRGRVAAARPASTGPAAVRSASDPPPASAMTTYGTSS